MKKEGILLGIGGLVVGVVATGLIAGAAVNKANAGIMALFGIDSSRVMPPHTSHEEMAGNETLNQLKGKAGDDFDKAFLGMMISHHEAATAMAELASTRAKHEEVKTLSQSIMSTQTKEINDMKLWQTNWGYDKDDSSHMMHGNH